jgi:hypothetical protein
LAREVTGGSQWADRAPAGARIFPGHLAETPNAPGQFQLTDQRHKATAYWWDNGSGGFVIENGDGLPLEMFASPCMPVFGAAAPLVRPGDLRMHRRSGGADFLSGPQRPTRIAYVGPWMPVGETL